MGGDLPSRRRSRGTTPDERGTEGLYWGMEMGAATKGGGQS